MSEIKRRKYLVLNYRSIGDYGVVGNLHTAALISNDGSVDWMCWPDFDSASVFGALLDSRVGGFFSLSPVSGSSAGTYHGTQKYITDTNVLSTRFETGAGAADIVDFMPVGRSGNSGGPRLIRTVTGVRGAVSFRLECRPRFDYGRARPAAHGTGDHAIFEAPGFAPLKLPGRNLLSRDGGAVSEFTVRAGDSRTFVLGDAVAATPVMAQAELEATIGFWRRWVGGTTYQGRWRSEVRRSLLTLKLLTYQPTGAMVAAPTTSLPEAPGGVRNWDYRYTWIRDSAFAMGAFIRAGFYDEAAEFLRFVEERLDETPDEPLRLMYGIRGERSLHEFELNHLEGYQSAAPVRVGNDAYRQVQLDYLGELIGAIDQYNQNGTQVSPALWGRLCRDLDWLADNWTIPDQGIWEVRGDRQHFTYSKMMSWSALDRGLSMMNGQGTPDRVTRNTPERVTRWSLERDRIRDTVLSDGWNEALGAFVQYLGSDVVDASMLRISAVGLLGSEDPRVVSTIDVIKGQLAPDQYVFRYDHAKSAGDGLTGSEGAFGLCTFWMVDALARSNRLEESLELFNLMLGSASPLGLYSEEFGPDGELAGNYPQGLTHLGMINSAIGLDAALSAAPREGSTPGSS